MAVMHTTWNHMVQCIGRRFERGRTGVLEGLTLKNQDTYQLIQDNSFKWHYEKLCEDSKTQE